MKVAKHKASGRWVVRIPARFSDSRRRESRYFDTKAQASEFVASFKDEQAEHGRAGVTAEQRRWLGYLQEHVGDLALLPTIVEHWKRTGERLEPIGATAAIRTFLDAVEPEYPNKRTWHDITERLSKFAGHFGDRPLHEISVSDVETFLGTFSAGWHRWGVYKRLKPFYKLAKRRRWIAADSMEEIPTPKHPTPEREIYTPEQFQNLLWNAEMAYPELLGYVALCGFGFLRTAELVRRFASEKVLCWQHILWSDNLIHVPVGVAKSTRRESGDERFIPLNDAAKSWLGPIRKTEGECVPHGNTHFTKLWREMTDAAKVPRIDNGLRHSAISYSLAANPEHGVALTASWAGNSEATIRKHYRRLLKPDVGKAWFQVTHYLE